MMTRAVAMLICDGIRCLHEQEDVLGRPSPVISLFSEIKSNFSKPICAWIVDLGVCIEFCFSFFCLFGVSKFFSIFCSGTLVLNISLIILLEPKHGIESRSLRKEGFRGQHDWPLLGY